MNIYIYIYVGYMVRCMDLRGCLGFGFPCFRGPISRVPIRTMLFGCLYGRSPVHGHHMRS